MTRSHVKFIVLALATLVIMFIMQAEKFVVDESLHFGQIKSLMDGDVTHISSITTFIIFHKIYAQIGNLLGLTQLVDFRLISFAFTFMMVFVIMSVCRDEDESLNWILASQLFFLPIALPYYPLIYTDIMALILMYLAYHQYSLKNHWATALLASLAVLIRQPSLVWIGLFATLTFFQSFQFNDTHLIRKHVRQAIIKIVPYILSALGFLFFFYLNGGISLGDKDSHQVAINLTNIYFMVVIFMLVFWPLFLSRYQQVYSLLKHKRWLLVPIIIGLPVYLFTFSVTHQYNSPTLNAFLRNWLLNHINDYLWLQLITYGLSAYTILALSTLKLKENVWNWLYLFLPLSVIAMPLIEHRYYIVGMAFWQLSRNYLSLKTEFIQLLWMILFSMFLYIGMSQTWFYL